MSDRDIKLTQYEWEEKNDNDQNNKQEERMRENVADAFNSADNMIKKSTDVMIFYFCQTTLNLFGIRFLSHHGAFVRDVN